MKNLTKILWITILFASLYYLYKYSIDLKNVISQELLYSVFKFAIISFVSGAATVSLLYEFKFSKASDSINLYKRELEKESINKTESDSKVKVLESKIQVLEKALDEALKK